jgi:hypothetical protein
MKGVSAFISLLFLLMITTMILVNSEGLFGILSGFVLLTIISYMNLYLFTAD